MAEVTPIKSEHPMLARLRDFFEGIVIHGALSKWGITWRATAGTMPDGEAFVEVSAEARPPGAEEGRQTIMAASGLHLDRLQDLYEAKGDAGLHALMQECVHNTLSQLLQHELGESLEVDNIRRWNSLAREVAQKAADARRNRVVGAGPRLVGLDGKPLA